VGENFRNWENFNKTKKNYPKWPNEVMLKLLFGTYLKNQIQLKSNMKVLDVGCGFGNNLAPFLLEGCSCSGTEVTAEMAAQTKDLLQKRGFSVDVKEGVNQKLPFEDKVFDVLISVNVIHYEKAETDIDMSFKEYKRVLKEGGKLILFTVGSKHDIFIRAKKQAPNKYEIADYDFRNGEKFFFFETQEFLKKKLEKCFNNVEIGRVTEELMNKKIDYFVGAANA